MTKIEVRTHDEVREKLQKIIYKYHSELTELKNTLAIPRYHFKF
jgi:hypothetical protein